MANTPTRLGQILLARGDITEQQLEEALSLQATNGQPVGACLQQLGYISEKTLKKALRRQAWLKPCAACLTCLVAPFSLQCQASSFEDSEFSSDWIEQQDNYSSWHSDLDVHLSSNQQSGLDFMKVAAEAAWDIYNGEPEAGEWQYSLSEQNGDFSVNMQMRF